MSIICLCAHACQALLRLDRANHTNEFSQEENFVFLQNNLTKLFVYYKYTTLFRVNGATIVPLNLN